MRNDKDFIIGLNVLGLTLARLSSRLSIHGSPAYMEAPLLTYNQVRNEVHRETPDVGQHDLSIYYKDTIIMRILMRVQNL